MISWNDILQEIEATRTAQGRVDLDGVSRAKTPTVAEQAGHPRHLDER
ncbi:MAG: hypothetical protein JSW71_06610 [Gemmatimonadota bacterium]|nr:MAG: hypothetical protein JSW71_06610 [Gemmatimonadota bacterium]